LMKDWVWFINGLSTIEKIYGAALNSENQILLNIVDRE